MVDPIALLTLGDPHLFGSHFWGCLGWVSKRPAERLVMDFGNHLSCQGGVSSFAGIVGSTTRSYGMYNVCIKYHITIYIYTHESPIDIWIGFRVRV